MSKSMALEPPMTHRRPVWQQMNAILGDQSYSFCWQLLDMPSAWGVPSCLQYLYYIATFAYKPTLRHTCIFASPNPQSHAHFPHIHSQIALDRTQFPLHTISIPAVVQLLFFLIARLDKLRLRHLFQNLQLCGCSLLSAVTALPILAANASYQ